MKEGPAWPEMRTGVSRICEAGRSGPSGHPKADGVDVIGLAGLARILGEIP